MKCYISILTISLVSLILFSGCVSNHFVPHAHNVPLFTEKKQTLTNLDISISAVDVQVAHSFSNHFAGMLNYKVQAQAPICLELGGGYFTPIKKFTVVELYGGIGGGRYRYTGANTRYDRSFKLFDPNNNYNYDININSFQGFIQPNIGIRPKENIVLALSFKSNFWFYPTYRYNQSTTSRTTMFGTNQYPEPIPVTMIDQKNATSLTLEPAFTFRFEGDGAKLMLQAGTYSTYYNQDLTPYDDSRFFVRLGLNWRLK